MTFGRRVSYGDARPGRDHIVIAGPSKTGTTGLYATIKAALTHAGHDYVTVFEPNRPETLDSIFVTASHRSVLVKSTLDKFVTAVPDPLAFERRLTTVRDPRDTLISALLFRPLTATSLRRADDAAVAQFVAALREKEQDPASRSVSELFALAGRLGIGGAPLPRMRKDLATQRGLVRRQGFAVVRYEQFVAREFAELEDYLGLELGGAGSSATYGHIARSKESGAFRHWFRDDDLREFDLEFGETLDLFGYPRHVELPERAVIDPATSSEYVEKRYRQRREQLTQQARARHDDTAGDPVTSDAEYLALLDGAEDGSAKDSFRLALVHLRGDRAAPDASAALQWARRSAVLGHAAGVALTVELLERAVANGIDAGNPTEPSLHRELRRWRAWRRPDGEAKVRAELDRLRTSARHRVGTLLVDAARDPRRNAVPAVREAVTVWRRRRAGRGDGSRER